MHTELVRAIVAASIVKTPDALRRQLASKYLTKRIKAEDSLVARIVVGLCQRS